jgi:nicotinamidase-related amidase
MKSENNVGILDKDSSLLLMIDVQEKFSGVIHNWEGTIKNIEKIVKAALILKVPILLTEQYPKGLGRTIPQIRKNLPHKRPIEKMEFNCFDSKIFSQELKRFGKKNIILCGIETHICVINTVLAAISMGFKVHLAVDAVSSRKESDKLIAIERAKQAGAFLTTAEMLIFQLTKTAQNKNFKKISEIVK